MSKRLVFVFQIICLVIGAAALPTIAAQAQEHEVKASATILLSTVAKQSNAVSSREVLPAQIGAKWRAAGAVKKSDLEHLPTDQKLSIRLEYGLQSVMERNYSNGREKVKVSALEMKYPSWAYGMWTFDRHSVNGGAQEFNSGRFVIRVESSGNAAPAELVSALQQYFASGAVPEAAPLSQEELPLLPTYLPQENRIAESEIYVAGPQAIGEIPDFADLKDLIDFTGGTHAAVASYHNGDSGRLKIMLIEYQTPQFATDGYGRISAHINGLPPEIRQQKLFKRIGNYVVVAANVADVAAAQTLLDQVKYMVKVYWEGEKLSAVPFEYRPPDPAAINEAVQTGRLLYTVFYWIGILLLGAVGLGFLTGGSLFYWKRHQRRRLGLDNNFSDAGGMVRLNLDHVLTSAAETGKLIGRGES